MDMLNQVKSRSKWDRNDSESWDLLIELWAYDFKQEKCHGAITDTTTCIQESKHMSNFNLICQYGKVRWTGHT